jgi:hypothetical protein
MVQASMLILLNISIYTAFIDEGKGLPMANTFPQNPIVLLVKFPCAIALHLFLYPQVETAMGIMKFANNQSD